MLECQFLIIVFLNYSVRGQILKIKLTVTIITLNEEYNIRRCIESVQNIADEIIVVDSGSTDKTEAIVKELGATFIYNQWPGHKEQKNFAIEKASSKWILSLDADEWIDEGLELEIKSILTDLASPVCKVSDDACKVFDDLSYNDSCFAYEIDRKTMFLGKFVKVWSPDWIIRLFRKDCGFFGGTNPHDLVVLNDGGHKKRLSNSLFHESYRNLDQFFLRNMSYSSIAAAAMRKKGRKFSFMKLIFSPQWAFFKKLFIKGAWKDGFRGLIISVTTFFYVFAKYAILWDLEKHEKGGDSGLVSVEHMFR